MTAEEIQALRRERPFRPVRFVLNDGSSYPVGKADDLRLWPSGLWIFEPTAENPAIFERFHIVDVAEVARIEPLGTGNAVA